MNKMAFLGFFACLLGLWLSSNIQPVWAEPAGSNSIIEMIEASAENEQLPVSIQIFGGEPINPDYFPWTLKFEYRDLQGKLQLCTATVVGEQVVFVAAHCVGANHSVIVRLRGHEKSYGLACKPNPKFDSPHGSYKADLMICRSDRKFPTTKMFESVNFSEVKRDTELFLLGYGCRDLNDEKRKTIGTLIGGSAKVNRVDNKHVITKGKEWDTPSTVGSDVVVCPGDSGGGVYLITEGRITETRGRSIIGVVSLFFPEERESFITAFSLPENQEFINEWSQDEDNIGIWICGVHPEAKNCR